MEIMERPTVEYAAWDDWDPKEYLAEYYQEVMADERFALEFLVESLKHLENVPLALDFGAGPAVHHAFPLVPKVAEIHLAEYLPANRAEIQHWLKRSKEAHDWSSFLLETVRLEGSLDLTMKHAVQREEETRRKITKVLAADAGETDPLGREMRGCYPLVTTHYCAEGATNSKEQWKRYMENIASLVSPGGTLILSACGAADYYCVGEHRFPCAGVTGHDVLESLSDNWFKSIDLRTRQVPDHTEQGYNSVIFARAVK